MGSAPGPHPDYLITLVGPGSGAGAGVPGVAVHEAATGRVTDRIISETEIFASVASTGTNRQFFLAVRGDPQATGARGPHSAGLPGGGIVSLRIDDDGTITGLSPVPVIPAPEPGQPGPVFLAATADGSTVAYHDP